MKRTIIYPITLTLAVALLAGCSPKPVPAHTVSPVATLTESQARDIFNVVPLDDDTCEIAGCLEDMEVLKIPETIGGYTVVGVGFAGLANLNNTRQITLPDTVEYIGSNAFANDIALESIDLGKGLKRIGEYAFNMCDSLEQVCFPEGMTTFVGYAFGLCASLDEVQIPASVTDMSIGPFQPDLYREQVKIVTSAGSAAEQFAMDNDIAVRHS